MDTATVKLVATKQESGDVDLSESVELSRRGSDGETHCLENRYGETQCIQSISLPGKTRS